MEDIIPKKQNQLSEHLSILFYLSLAFLAIVLAANFTLGIFIKNTNNDLAKTEEELAKERGPEELSLQQEILGDQKKIDDFSKLESRHLDSSGIFSLLEREIHPKVRFSQMNFDARKGNLTLAGESSDFESLGQQMIVFHKEKTIKNISLDSVALGKAGVTFNLTMGFDPQIFTPF